MFFDNKSDLEFIEKLYIESFPPNERRPVLQMNHLLEDNNKFNMFLLLNDDDEKVGFMNYWTFDTFIYLEHFAINPEFRNGGYGKKSIESLLNSTTLPLVAEIELPSVSDFAKRRLKFYEKLGFKVWDIFYEQPPYEEGNESIPMLLLTYRELDLGVNEEFVINKLYSHVYNKKIV